MKENTPGHRITELVCIIAIDEDGDEGIPAIEGLNGVLMPMVTSKAKLVPVFIAAARENVKRGRMKSFKVLRFTNAVEVQEYTQRDVDFTRGG